MSAADSFLGTDDIKRFASDLKEWPNSSYGNDQITHNVSHFVSFYFLYDSKHHLDTSLLMVDIHEEFERLTGNPYLIGTHPDSEQLKFSLNHPNIKIEELSMGQWIELGDEPSLYPVEDGVPALPVLLNKLLKPIRHDHMGLLSGAQRDGDPNERFNDADSLRWMQRFDADSDWPSAGLRQRRDDVGQDVAAPAEKPLKNNRFKGK